MQLSHAIHIISGGLTAWGGFMLLKHHMAKREEMAIRKGEERYQAILDAAPDAIVITDLRARILMASPASLGILCCPDKSRLMGRPITDFLAPEERHRAKGAIQGMFQGIKPGPNVYRGLRWDASEFDLEANAEFVCSRDGEIRQIVFIVRDLSERLQAERKRKHLEAQLLRCQKLENIERQSLSLARDMQSVLGTIMALTSATRDNPNLDDATHQALKNIHTASHRGADLLKGLLDLTRREN